MSQKVEATHRRWVCLAALLLLAGWTGCRDTVGAEGWNLGADTGTVIDDPAPVPDTGVPSDPPPDTGTPADDTGTGKKADAIQPRPDTDGRELIEEEGWYVTGFEQSEFIPQEEIRPRGRFDGGECRVALQNQTRQRERWWANWRLPSSPRNQLQMFPPDDVTDGRPVSSYGFYDVRGHLSPEGEYGHLGGYNRKFEIIEAEIDVCRSVSQLGHCAVPSVSGPNCVVTNRTEIGRDDDERMTKRQFSQHARPSGESRYTLGLGSNHVDSWDIQLTFVSDSGPVGEEVREVDGLESVNMAIRGGWTGAQTYTGLRGWVAAVPNTESETLYVSISGTLPESADARRVPERLHVWGAYTVTQLLEAGN